MGEARLGAFRRPEEQKELSAADCSPIALQEKPFFVKDTTPIPRSNDGHYRTVDLRLQ